jgi:MoCo/4Fe-4S cofactor protein with predicted Tat translocation signal
MKTIPPPCPEPETGPKYWRSLDELADTPEFRQWMQREFPAGASEFSDPFSRRHFVRIMSASFLFMGAAALTGCRRPEENILPFSRMPEDYIHGVSKFFATGRPTRSAAVPLLVRSHEGRPVKIEGNSDLPGSNGGTDVFTQASILNLYDPDRAMRFTRAGATAKPEEALDFLSTVAQGAAKKGGEGLAFLLEQSGSPSRERIAGSIRQKFPKAKWYIYEPVDLDSAAAATAVFGQSVRPFYKLDEARVILSLDWDFIGGEEGAHDHIRRFTKGRKIKSSKDVMNRLYAVEGLFTLTGLNADHRLRLAPSLIPALTARLALEVLKAAGNTGDLASVLEPLAAPAKPQEQWILECAKDLTANRGASIVMAGYRQPAAIQQLALVLNSALGNIGKTVALLETAAFPAGSLKDLADALKAGQVETLVISGSNPVYTAPADLDWTAAQRKAKTVLRLGMFEDETAATVDWHYPVAHYLESWGDARTSDGTVVSVQPLTAPLFGGMTEIEFLARLGGEEVTKPYEIVRATFFKAGGNEEDWKQYLHDGHLKNSAAKSSALPLAANAALEALKSLKPAVAPTPAKMDLVFYRDAKVDDGRYANNGWLQELPDPVTKLTWDNAILISPKTAAGLGLRFDDEKQKQTDAHRVLEIEANGRKIRGPVWIQPGLSDDTVAVSLGYGREKTGRVGRGTGFNAYPVRVTGGEYLISGASVTKTGGTYTLSATQSHWSMEGRPVIREANLEQYKKNPQFAKGMSSEKPPIVDSLYPNPLDQAKLSARYQWGMSIDLNSCVGCSACMIACQSENNIPIVGKEQVGRSREMHWIRIDRYYVGAKGDSADPQAITQPMLCQHCESAPCESVCPVNATAHDDEGLNVMVYNRCVGTRYCSNNCPYKVRRFNFFDYNRRPLDRLYESPLDPRNQTDGKWEMLRWLEDRDRGSKPADEWEMTKLLKNPDVTLRMRGVMEKCSFCLQRIEGAKIAQKVAAADSGDVEVREGVIKTACQQACPAGAIVFGNIKDPQSRVSQAKDSDRDYSVLDFLNTKPRTTYLARVRNPNPAMPDPYKDSPGSWKEFIKANGPLEGGEEPAAEGARAKGGL